MGKKMIMTPEIQQIVKIVEDFLKVKKLICYGGTAINNLLPISDLFYRKDIELRDYDFYSMNALNHAKELADIYYKIGFEEVEAKAGQHYGTYKVYVNLTDQKEPKLNFLEEINDVFNNDKSQINFCKSIIKPNAKELKEHQDFLKKSLKKNYF